MHPRQRPIEQDLREELVSRRKFLARMGGAAVAGGALPFLLDACGKSSAGGGGGGGGNSKKMLPRPNKPVKWPISSDNKAIKSGLKPEKNATLQVFNWDQYLNPKLFKQFEKKYDCKVQLTTFTDLQEGLQKVQSGQFNFDVYFPEVDILPPLIENKVLAPLNHSYIPNMANLWRSYDSPWYDVDAQYTVPYTVYTTGLGYRKDHVHEDPFKMSTAGAWGIMWNKKYKGRVAILDDVGDGLACVALKLGITDFSSGYTSSQLAAIERELLALKNNVSVQVDNNDYTYLPEGRVYVHQAWSGDIVSAPYYLPKGTSPDVLGYWYTLKGGMIDNDLITVMRTGKNPVLAHLFLNFMLDYHNVLENMSWTGYQQPQRKMNPNDLVKQGLVAPNLTSCIVQESYFKHGWYNELPQTPEETAKYQGVWERFTTGV
jgi:spermidine/putrescine transport system substrate-binding protein